MTGFVHLRLHTEYSLVDGIVRIPELMQAVTAARMPAVALTDQSNLFGMVKFYKEAQAAGIKPLIGVDAWIREPGERTPASRLVLLCQPIVPIRHGARVERHFELLLRMRDENGRIVSPDNFMSAAERYNIMPNIDRWVIENALRWLVSEADEREKLAMCSINLSGQSLGDDKFLPFVIDQFHRSGLDATKICFEITETAAIASFSQANRFIQALKELGCKFALDDFGTGLSSFGYLKHFPVDFLKIDGSFVKEILHDPIDREMVRSINEIGHLTGKQTIAEFAENAEIITMLRSLGVDYAQGYGISMPQRVLKAANIA